MESIYRGETQHKKGRAYQYFWMFDRHMDRTMCCSMENATMKSKENKQAYPDKSCRQNRQIYTRARSAPHSFYYGVISSCGRKNLSGKVAFASPAEEERILLCYLSRLRAAASTGVSYLVNARSTNSRSSVAPHSWKTFRASC